MQGTTGRVVVGVLWLLLLVVMAGAWGAGARSAKAAVRQAPTLTKPASVKSVQPSSSITDLTDRSEDASSTSPAVDLYGNEIERAVGDYRIDFRGDIYETHAPDTAITELGAPAM
jgi:hypothetical protein